MTTAVPTVTDTAPVPTLETMTAITPMATLQAVPTVPTVPTVYEDWTRHAHGPNVTVMGDPLLQVGMRPATIVVGRARRAGGQYTEGGQSCEGNQFRFHFIAPVTLFEIRLQDSSSCANHSPHKLVRI